jgi:hypothetical protein
MLAAVTNVHSGDKPMRIHHILLPIVLVIGLAACQTSGTTNPTPVPVNLPPSEVPGSGSVTPVSLTLLTAAAEDPRVPLIQIDAIWIAFQDGNGPWKPLKRFWWSIPV